MGHNTIRLGVLWAGLEPVEGEYNMTYLEQIKICVDTAERYGLFPVLDMHQAGQEYLQMGSATLKIIIFPNFPRKISMTFKISAKFCPS